MALAAILVREVAVMFLLLAAGILCQKTGILSEENARALSNLLLLVIVPSLLLRSLQTERDPSLYFTMGIVLVLSVLFHWGAILAAKHLFPDPGDSTTAWRVSRLAVVFSNAGFMGFPLLLATVGEESLLYGAIYIGVFNTVSWVWCVPTLTGKGNLSLRQLLAKPAILSLIAGTFLYFTGLRLPGIANSFVNYLAEVNTPLSMLIIGVFLASVKPGEALRDPAVYRVVFMRNLVLPLVTLLLLWAVRLPAWLPQGRTVALAFLILVSCPAGATTILMSARYGCDSGYGSKVVTLSTLLSILTLPLVILLADLIL